MKAWLNGVTGEEMTWGLRSGELLVKEKEVARAIVQHSDWSS